MSESATLITEALATGHCLNVDGYGYPHEGEATFHFEVEIVGNQIVTKFKEDRSNDEPDISVYEFGDFGGPTISTQLQRALGDLEEVLHISEFSLGKMTFTESCVDSAGLLRTATGEFMPNQSLEDFLISNSVLAVIFRNGSKASIMMREDGSAFVETCGLTATVTPKYGYTCLIDMVTYERSYPSMIGTSMEELKPFLPH